MKDLQQVQKENKQLRKLLIKARRSMNALIHGGMCNNNAKACRLADEIDEFFGDSSGAYLDKK